MSITNLVKPAKSAFMAEVVPQVERMLHDKGVYGKSVAGVSLIPVHVYGSAGSKPELIGRRCVILGREGDGVFTNKLNFFGGKMFDKQNDGVATEIAIADVLFEEVYEEAGFLLDARSFLEALIDVIAMPFGNQISLMFIVNLVGFSTGRWQVMYKDRYDLHRTGRLDWKYVEMTEVVHVPIADLATHPEVSAYVRGAATYVDQATQSLREIQNKGTFIVDYQSQYVVIQNGLPMLAC